MDPPSLLLLLLPAGRRGPARPPPPPPPPLPTCPRGSSARSQLRMAKGRRPRPEGKPPRAHLTGHAVTRALGGSGQGERGGQAAVGPGHRAASPPHPPHRSSLLCLPPTAPRPRAPGCRRLPFLETPERPPRGWPRSVLFICCFNLLSFFSVQGRGSSSAVLPSVCLSVCTSWAGWGLGPGARWMAPSGCGGCQWMQCPASYCKL